MQHRRIAVVGAGAAGLMAAQAAAGASAYVTVYERNSIAGKKLLIAGKGRCNFTHDGPAQEIVDAFDRDGRFLYSALSDFGPQELCELMKSLGVDYKVERGKRVFPVSDRASDVRDALLSSAQRLGAQFVFGSRASRLLIEGGAAAGFEDYEGHQVQADAVIIATGGASYPGTGSTGDGYGLARQAGHAVKPPLPALVAMETVEAWPGNLAGLSLKNVELTLYDHGREAGREFGEMLFTHWGVSGPIVLSASRAVCTSLRSSQGLAKGRFTLAIDLKPALDEQTLDRRVTRDLREASRKQLKNSLDELLPKALIPVVIAISGIDETTTANQVTTEQRSRIVHVLKALPLTVKRTRPLEEAIVTSGGVELSSVDSRTMESKLVSGLYFAGELLDLDAPTGGYNLQAAFSTGHLAGLAAAGAKRVRS
ncbi:MAG: aminoacetone oxidase family FAD-binding enzyme [Clostridia bacterium]|nr:aminoacetone oxidase family FAD-binding enzyme [Clostridia bacterium]